ncbi:hypothetical protein BO94DRAFT_577848 [Aspergillus sclerotioniger CBS 115572]|uniref:Uncharacterized protein n=1 Tax=Aspergillus sclerotioniger CBS 115572 TaxID=1450535 RepID=A0A317VNV0_9EURO|nr:hypothetical protein BO94DRAFT_577848 [Aspergillus sclerotioniger CBS 115572]PWY76044.1 hypothetical protein BO94DRAFT_577848 [Aspergillus sclerotioniger CBS 115572]
MYNVVSALDAPYDQISDALVMQIFRIAWESHPQPIANPNLTTWWEYFQPSRDLHQHYHPWLIEFLKRAYYLPDAPEFFYYIHGLSEPRNLIDVDFNETFEAQDCYVLLHQATPWQGGDEWGIFIDQITCQAVFVEDLNYHNPIYNVGWGFRPLEDIYTAYLQMIVESKVQRVPRQLPFVDLDDNRVGPWNLCAYTQADVCKAAEAFQSFLNEIKGRLPASTTENRMRQPLPWSHSSVRTEASIAPNSFVDAFCRATTAGTNTNPGIKYIAPGIRLPTAEEFPAIQPFRESSFADDESACPILPTLLFIAEGEEGEVALTVPDPGIKLNSLVRRKFSSGGAQPRPAGLYLSGDDRAHTPFENGCHLLLPFGVGRNRWARRSDNTYMGKGWDREYDIQTADQNSELYQSVFNGMVPHRHVLLHIVLSHWAEQVKTGRWRVGETGVMREIGVWREADTEQGWKMYWVPSTW